MKKGDEMIKRISAAFLAAIFCFCLLTGCSPSGAVPDETPEAHVTEEPTAAPTPEPTEEPTAAPTPEPTAEPIESVILRYVGGMTDAEKIGELVMFGCGGKTEPDPGFIAFLSEHPVGGLFIGTENIDKNDGSGGFDSVKRLIAAIEESCPSKTGRLYSVDVEGGGVVRFGWEPAIKAPYYLNGPDEALPLFTDIGKKLIDTGINTDLAPVFDISEDPLSTFLGTRIISSDLNEVASTGGAMIAGLHAGGCIACAKHFPGHGATEEDSHDHTPVVKKSAEALYAYDLAAFRAAIDAGADMIMAAHISYPALDENDIASMSKPIITGILRGELGFDGVVITDAMGMGGLVSRYTLEEAAVRFILAGGDIVLCGNDPAACETIINSLDSAVSSGEISTERLDESVCRVLLLKYRYGIFEP